MVARERLKYTTCTEDVCPRIHAHVPARNRGCSELRLGALLEELDNIVSQEHLRE